MVFADLSKVAYRPLSVNSDDHVDIEEKPQPSVGPLRVWLPWCTALCVVLSLIFAPLFVVWYLESTESNSEGIATTINGTYSGVYLPNYNQHVFLGMPYAEPPLESLRFRSPMPASDSWTGIRQANEYSPHCVGYGSLEVPFPKSEDCLTINVVRPAVQHRGPLPVAVYVHGGGIFGGGTSDPRYNFSFIVSHAAKNNLPFIAVSFNYRSSLWGWITSKEVFGSGNSNIALQDQRMALRWVQENIHAFGGDSKRVTLWGASAGADFVGQHLLAFDGENDQLFRAAILQSGNPLTRSGLQHQYHQKDYDKIVKSANCDDTENTLECLRNLPFERLNDIWNDTSGGTSKFMQSMAFPAIDGTMVPRYGSLSVKASQMANVPILSGLVTNEGQSWVPHDVGTWDELRIYLTGRRGYPPSVVEKLLSFYPDNPSKVDMILDPPIKSVVSRNVWDRMDAFFGDIEHNARQRLLCGTYSNLSKCYSYRFDALPGNTEDSRWGVIHSDEIGPIFQNFDGLGHQGNPFKGKGQGYYDMSKRMGLLWASFITHLDPNPGFKDESHVWPLYSTNKPQNLVLNDTVPGSCWLEADDLRMEATTYINTIQHSVLGK